MDAASVTVVTAWQGGSPWLSALVTGVFEAESRPVVAADLSGITFRVWDVQGGEVGLVPEALVPADVIRDTVQGGNGISAADYNFAFQLDGGVYLPRGNRLYRVEAELELANSNDTIPVAWGVWADDLRGL